MSTFSEWKTSVLGRSLDVDGNSGPQCVDVVKDWAQHILGVPWSKSIGYGNAKDIFANANPQYFEKITNDHNNPNQLPSQGDIIVFAASPEAGYTSSYANPYGHTAVVDTATPNGLVLVQQDGSQNQPVTQVKNRAWKYTRCIGWLHPKVEARPPANPVPISHPETVKPGNWNVRTQPSVAAPTLEGVVVGGQKYDTVIVAGNWRRITFRGQVGYVGPKAW